MLKMWVLKLTIESGLEGGYSGAPFRTSLLNWPFCCPFLCRGVAQSGSASVLGTEGRRFKSSRPDHLQLAPLFAFDLLAVANAKKSTAHFRSLAPS